MFGFLQAKKTIVHNFPKTTEELKAELVLAKSRDNRTLKSKVMVWFWIGAFIYLVAVHFFAALYFTNSHLVTKIESAPIVVSPLPAK